MWYQEREEGALLFIKVVPSSKKNTMSVYTAIF